MSDRAVSPTDLNPSAATHGSNSNIEPQANMAPPAHARESKKPARKAPFTVSSVLPKCDYKEEWEPKERRTDAYLSIQSEKSRPHPIAISYSELIHAI